ncbi:hypothetical protein SMB34_04810 [Thalassospira permensis NBRC 106175]|uniref:Uncharacterized protein n=1 Tax=Thalassospira permensis NBRC 106175 TaxID=1353532 RepID=A0ABR4TMH4_9PROT|nr:hypothetical protein SMB34_04810 [Thalassospira permensis NBRC 106175]
MLLKAKFECLYEKPPDWAAFLLLGNKFAKVSFLDAFTFVADLHKDFFINFFIM